MRSPKRSGSPRRRGWLILVVLVLGACGETEAPIATDDSAPRIAADPTCHYPTTVPGGVVEQPQCEVPTTTAETAGLPSTPWVCPTEDYPIHVVATSWPAYANPPGAVPACGGGTLKDIAIPTTVLVPSRTVDGLAEEGNLGLIVLRQPGSRFWQASVAIPAVADPKIELTSLTIGAAMPDDLRSEWRSEQFAARCSPENVQLLIRGEMGCRAGSTYTWSAGDTLFTLQSRLDLETAAIVDWLGSWVEAP